MDHGKVQVCHRRANHSSSHLVILRIEVGAEFADKARDKIAGRPFVDDLTRRVVLDVDRSRSPGPGIGLVVVPYHHEMQRTDQAAVIGDVIGIGQPKDVVHRAAIADNGKPGVVPSVFGTISIDGRDRILLRHDVALDAVRALNRTRTKISSKQSPPPSWPIMEADLEIPPKISNQPEDPALFRGQVRLGEDGHAKYIITSQLAIK